MNHILILWGILSTFLLTSLAINDGNFSLQLVRAHDFSTTDESVIVTLVEQIKAETQIVITKLLSDNDDSVHDHARYAAKLMKALDDNITKSTPLINIAQAYDDGQKNSSTLAMVFANLLDDILTKYGGAIGLKYDMTNMSNMQMVSVPSMDDTSSSSHSMGTALTIDQYNQYILGKQLNDTEGAWNISKIVHMDIYETAQVLSDSIIEKLTSELRPRSLINETANIDRLEASLRELNLAIDKNALPEVVMETVHVQIHPMLQEIYNLQVVRR